MSGVSYSSGGYSSSGSIGSSYEDVGEGRHYNKNNSFLLPSSSAPASGMGSRPSRDGWILGDGSFDGDSPPPPSRSDLRHRSDSPGSTGSGYASGGGGGGGRADRSLKQRGKKAFVV